MNSKQLRIALLAVGLLGLIVLVFFFLSRGPVCGEIEGRVTRGGVPLENVEVIFYPEETGPRSVALTDKDGHFEALTDAIQKVPAGKRIPVGKYRVALVDHHDQVVGMQRMAQAKLAGQTAQTKATGRTARAQAARAKTLDPLGDSALLVENMKNTPNSVRVPARYNKRLDTPIVDIEVKPGKNSFDLEVK